MNGCSLMGRFPHCGSLRWSSRAWGCGRKPHAAFASSGISLTHGDRPWDPLYDSPISLPSLVDTWVSFAGNILRAIPLIEKIGDRRTEGARYPSVRVLYTRFVVRRQSSSMIRRKRSVIILVPPFVSRPPFNFPAAYSCKVVGSSTAAFENFRGWYSK